MTTKKATAKNTDSIADLIRRTDIENPKCEDLKKIRAHLDQNAGLVEANRASEHVFRIVIEGYSKSALVKEMLERQIRDARKALEYTEANAFVKMLIDQVILNNIRLNQVEALHAAKLGGSHTSEHGYYWDRRLSSAQRRFLKACESLARVKKLLAEGEMRDAQAKNKQTQSALSTQKLYKMLSS